jgi:basic membrane protein A and related proteins
MRHNRVVYPPGGIQPVNRTLSTLALAASLLVSFGCDKGGDEPGKANGGKRLVVGVVFDSGGRGDKSFNDSAWAGIERAQTEYDIDAKPVESKSEKDYEPNLTEMAEQGADIVFAVGINMKSALEKVAPNYPNVKFAIIDAPVSAPNVRALLFKEEEGSFLAGYLAGLMTKTNKIGFVGGMQIPLIEKFAAGYEAGARTANPAVQMLPEKYTGSWDNVDNAKVAASVLFNSGADIVYHAAGRAGLGVIAAAKEQGKYAIGVDSDQDYLEPGTVLTSMVKRVDEAVYSTIKDIRNGKFSAGEVVYDLKAGGVGLSEMKHTKDAIGADKLAKVNDVAEKVKSGDIQVPASKSALADYVAGLK